MMCLAMQTLGGTGNANPRFYDIGKPHGVVDVGGAALECACLSVKVTRTYFQLFPHGWLPLITTSMRHSIPEIDR